MTSSSATCKRCLAHVMWAVMPHGSSILMDAQPSEAGNIRLERVNGQLCATVELARPPPTDVPLYCCHFATCTGYIADRLHHQRKRTKDTP